MNKTITYVLELEELPDGQTAVRTSGIKNKMVAIGHMEYIKHLLLNPPPAEAQPPKSQIVKPQIGIRGVKV